MPADVDEDNDFDDLNTSNNSIGLHDDMAISDNHFFAQKPGEEMLSVIFMKKNLSRLRKLLLCALPLIVLGLRCVNKDVLNEFNYDNLLKDTLIG